MRPEEHNALSRLPLDPLLDDVGSGTVQLAQPEAGTFCPHFMQIALLMTCEACEVSNVIVVCCQLLQLCTIYLYLEFERTYYA